MSEQESTKASVDLVVSRARAAANGPGRNARLCACVLDGVAASLGLAKQNILSAAAEETALTEAELAPEFARMTGTLRMFATLVREGSWVRAAIDTARADGAGVIGPNHDVRRMLVPLDGVVAVFGASNFPLAYGVCGGDMASALAAGCGVVVKEHPAHPRTGRLISAIARRGLRDAGAEPDLLGYVEHTDPRDYSVAEALLMHPQLAAVGFTGSVGGGRAIDKLAREREMPVPVFAEMGSVNTVIVTPAAAVNHTEEVATRLADSILARHGQQCTRPGLILVPEGNWAPAGSGALVNAIAQRIGDPAERQMLAPWIRDAYVRRVEEVSRCAGVEVVAGGGMKEDPRGASAVLFKVDQAAFAAQPTFREEVFGPAAIMVMVSDPMKLLDGGVPRGLTCTMVYDPDFEDEEGVTDAMSVDLLLDRICGLGGRIIFNGVPTGVRVAHGMVHGGPWPATNRPDTTAVGPYAIERWCRPVCFQNCPDELLPPELRDGNPLGILRVVDGVASRDAVVRGG